MRNLFEKSAANSFQSLYIYIAFFQLAFLYETVPLFVRIARFVMFFIVVVVVVIVVVVAVFFPLVNYPYILDVLPLFNLFGRVIHFERLPCNKWLLPLAYEMGMSI